MANIQNRPTAFVDHVVKAVLPLINDDGDGLRDQVCMVDVHHALVPTLGEYTVADAVFAVGMLYAALQTMPVLNSEGKECRKWRALFEAIELLEDFSSVAKASSPQCASARAYLLQQHQADEWNLGDAGCESAMREMMHDCHAIQERRFEGERFDGASTRPGLGWLNCLVYNRPPNYRYRVADEQEAA